MSHFNTKPYNAFLDAEDRLTLEVGVAGFAEDELSVERVGQYFHVAGVKTDKPAEVKSFYTRGLSYRNFKDTYVVPYQWKVQSAELINGVLRVRFVEEKEKVPVINVAAKLKEIQEKAKECCGSCA